MDRRYLQIQSDFTAEDLKQMELAPKYNTWLFSLMRPYLGRRIFEVGSGIGNMTKYLIASAKCVFGIEPNLACIEELERTLGSNPKFECRPWKIEQCNIGLLQQYRFDTVVCVNVLEHIEDDVSALESFKSIVVKRGRVVLLVPAVPRAYGSIDASVGHFRRYSKTIMSNALCQTGFEVEVLKYTNFMGLIAWFYNGRVKRITKQSEKQIQIFDLLVPWYSRLEETVSPPIGMSLLAVGKKTE